MLPFYIIATLLTFVWPLSEQIADSGLVLDEQNPHFACPVVDVDFWGNDIDEVQNVMSWQDCSMYIFFLIPNP